MTIIVILCKINQLTACVVLRSSLRRLHSSSTIEYSLWMFAFSSSRSRPAWAALRFSERDWFSSTFSFATSTWRSSNDMSFGLVALDCRGDMSGGPCRRTELGDKRNKKLRSTKNGNVSNRRPT